jgi:hypothetical protein
MARVTQRISLKRQLEFKHEEILLKSKSKSNSVLLDENQHRRRESSGNNCKALCALSNYDMTKILLGKGSFGEVRLGKIEFFIENRLKLGRLAERVRCSILRAFLVFARLTIANQFLSS